MSSTYEQALEKAKNNLPMTPEELELVKYGNSEDKTTKESVKDISTLSYEELIEKAKKGEKLTEDEEDRLKYHKEEEQSSQLSILISGVNNIWEKTYDFKESGLKFTIKVHAPTIVEQGKINALREQYLQGSGSFTPTTTFVAFQMLATIRVCGEEVPKIFENDDNIYATQILYRVGVDFHDWLNRFQY